MKILITGSSSYVGKYIIEGLLDLGHKIIGTSRGNPNINRKNFTWISHDLSISPLEIYNKKIDLVIHVAGLAWMNRGVKEYVSSNIFTTINLEKMLKKLKPKVTFYMSSRDVYGDISSNNISENTPIINPIIYGHTKYLAENILSENGPTIIFRLPSVIGIGTHGWIDSIFKKLINNKDINFVNTRFNNFIHASELPLIIQTFINKSIFNTDRYVVGCSNISNSKTLLNRMKNLLNSKSSLIEKKDSKSYYTISIKKLKKIYKTMTVEQTIDKYINEMT